jgi:hypothetical protein
VDPPIFHRSPGGDQCLARDLAAEDPLQILFRAAATEEIWLEHFEVEEGDQIVEGLLHTVPC